MFEWLIVPSLQFFIFGSVKNDVLKDFRWIKKWMTLAVINKNIFKVTTLPNNLVLT